MKNFLNEVFGPEELIGSYLKVGVNNENGYKQSFFLIKNDLEETVEEVVAFAEENAGSNIYLGPFTFTEQDSKRQSVSYITAFYADYDEYKGKSLKDMDPTEAEEARKLIENKLMGLYLKPNLVVNSGNGIHAYWILDKPLKVEDKIHLVEAALKKLAGMFPDFKGDFAASKIGHTLRLPGSINYKDPESPKECKTVYNQDYSYYSFEKIIKQLGVKVEEKVYEVERRESMYETYSNLGVSTEGLKEVIKKCEFMLGMAKYPEMQTYELWLHIAMNLAVFGKEGRAFFHVISKGYKNYEFSEAEKLFNSVVVKVESGEYLPTTCARIGECGFECSKTCEQKTPAGMMLAKLMAKTKAQAVEIEELSIEEEIDKLVPNSTEVGNIRLLQDFIDNVLNRSEESMAVKQVYLKEAMRKLGVPERGNFGELKKRLSDTVNENINVRIAKEVLSQEDIAFIGFHFYTYKEGIWEEYKALDELVLDKLGSGFNKTRLDNIIKYLSIKARVDMEDINNYRTQSMICLKNGMLNLENGDKLILTPHNKAYYATSRIDIEWDPKAECPKFLEFLEKSFSNLAPKDKEDTIRNLLEWMGYCLIPGNELQVMLFLIGASRAGKGVFLDAVMSLLGKVNVAALSISEMHEEFNSIQLLGKLANVGREIGRGEDFNEAFVKSATGEDEISGRYLRENPVFFKNKAKLMFSSNHLPKILDQSEALYNRALCIPMNNVVAAENRNYNLKNELKEELPGILKLAVEARIELFKRGRFLESTPMKKLKSKMKKSNNVAMDWLEENHTRLDKKAKHLTLKKCYESYKNFCTDEGIKPIPRGEFKEGLCRIDGIEVERLSKPDQDCVLVDWTLVDKLFGIYGEEGPNKSIAEVEKKVDTPERKNENGNISELNGKKVSEAGIGMEEKVMRIIREKEKDRAALA